jgi:hypothetical protein
MTSQAGQDNCKVRFSNSFEESRNAAVSEEFQVTRSRLEGMIASLCKADRSGAESVSREYKNQWASLGRAIPGEKITVVSRARHL